MLNFGVIRRVLCVVTCTVVGGGVWSTFPVLFPTATVGFYIHSAITTILSFNTLFNYCMAAFRRAGPPPTVEWGRYDLVPRQALEGYKFCVYCKLPKPPNAHHCRSCQSCVIEMDHHCPFVNNLTRFSTFSLFSASFCLSYNYEQDYLLDWEPLCQRMLHFV